MFSDGGTINVNPSQFQRLWESAAHSSLVVPWKTAEQSEFTGRKSQPTPLDGEVPCISAHLGDGPGDK